MFTTKSWQPLSGKLVPNNIEKKEAKMFVPKGMAKSIKERFGIFGFLDNSFLIFVLSFFLLFGAITYSREFTANQDLLNSQLEAHAANKQKVLDSLTKSPKLKMTRLFAMDFREVWRRIIVDGEYEGQDKLSFLQEAAQKCNDENDSLARALRSLLKSHRDLFGSDKNKDLIIRFADDQAFRPFGINMSLTEAIARITEGSDAEIQAFKTIFETGQNTRGYIHKLECHAEAVEFIYAITDIVYGVMLPDELSSGPKRIVADPKKVRLYYVRAGDVIMLYPNVLHSGSLSVEPDRSFSIVIYKKPIIDTKELVVKLPKDWAKRQKFLKIENVDKYFLTLEELHIAELETNCGYIADKRPLRLPVWQK